VVRQVYDGDLKASYSERDLTTSIEHLLEWLGELHEEVSRILGDGLSIAACVVEGEGRCVAENDEDFLRFLRHGCFLGSVLGGVEGHKEFRE
jgi:hypothetical protein